MDSPLKSCSAKPRWASDVAAIGSAKDGEVGYMKAVEKEIDAFISKVHVAQAKAKKTAERHGAAEGAVNMVLEEEDDDQLMAATERVKIRPAMDSGSVANVLAPGDLPCDIEVEPNTTGKHFAGANNPRIEKYGTCRTVIHGAHGDVGCDWNVANVSRPLNSVSQVTGPADGDGKYDVLFSNKRCIVVPPGIVELLAKRLPVTAEYPREGNLYIGDMELSTFGGQGTGK